MRLTRPTFQPLYEPVCMLQEMETTRRPLAKPYVPRAQISPSILERGDEAEPLWRNGIHPSCSRDQKRLLRSGQWSRAVPTGAVA